MYAKSKSFGAATFRTYMTNNTNSNQNNTGTLTAPSSPRSTIPSRRARSLSHHHPYPIHDNNNPTGTAVQTRQLSRVHRTIVHRQTLSSLPDEFFRTSSSSTTNTTSVVVAPPTTSPQTSTTLNCIPPEYRRDGGISSRSLLSLFAATSNTNQLPVDADAAGGTITSTTDHPTKTLTSSSAACNLLTLVIGAIGVVFGDIGTSPLYTLNTVLANIPLFQGTDRTKVNRSEIVVATYCLMFYTLVWVVLIKYVLWVMRVNHHGAGGELAMAQVILKGLDPSLVEGDTARNYKLPLPGKNNNDTTNNSGQEGEGHDDDEKVSTSNPLLERNIRNGDHGTTTTTTTTMPAVTASAASPMANGNDSNIKTMMTNPSPAAAETTPSQQPQQQQPSSSVRKRSTLVMTIAMMSTGFLIGDGVITPPNTVLGALHSPVLAELSISLNVLISCLVLIFIFNVQKFGSKAIGYVSGPIMILWFSILAILGGMAVGRYPEEAKFMVRAFNPAVLAAFSGGEDGVYPPHVGFYNAFLSLSGVILCITGAEALYADLGHFGYSAIMVSWCFIIFPALALHYFGQCCYVISLGRDMENYPPSMAESEEYQTLVNERELFNTQLIEVPGNLVYALVPTQDMSYMAGQACLWLLTIVAVLASIIASQALISGVFSILTQAYALDLMPRMTILHTNPDEKGQVFIKEANTMMCVVCVIIVLLFQTSDRLTAAYGIAVAFCMFFTDILMGFVMNWVWKFHWIVAIGCCVPFVFVDGLYLSANVIKLGEGAESWISIIIAFVAWFCMQAHWWTKTTIKAKAGVRSGGGAGRVSLLPSSAGSVTSSSDIDHLLRLLNESKLLKRMPVAGVFLTPYPKTYPRCLSTLARTMAALPETIILLHISFSRDKPYVTDEERYDLTCHSEALGVYSLNLYYGYAEPITAEHFDVNNSLQDIFESEGYAALRKLTEDRGPTTTEQEGETIRRVSDWARINASLTESMLLAPFEEFGTEPATSASADNHHWTYFLGARNYVPHNKENVFIRLFVYTCDFLSRNSKSSRDFFGLTNVDTIEVNCVTMIHTKDYPSSVEATELVELVGLDAGEQA